MGHQSQRQQLYQFKHSTATYWYNLDFKRRIKTSHVVNVQIKVKISSTRRWPALPLICSRRLSFVVLSSMEHSELRLNLTLTFDNTSFRHLCYREEYYLGAYITLKSQKSVEAIIWLSLPLSE